MKILIPADGTPGSVPVIMQGGFAARTFGARPTLLAVVPSKKYERQAEKILEDAQRRLAEIGVEAETKIRFGRPNSELLAEVKEGAYDLLIMGKMQKSKWLEGSWGDPARKVLSSTSTAVLFARGVSDGFYRILLCESLGLDGTLVQALKKRFPPLFKGKRQLTILHVMSQIGARPGVKSWELRASAEELMGAGTLEGELIKDELNELAEKNRAQVKPKVRHGAVVDQIMAEAEEGGYDLVVIGAHHPLGWQRLLLEDMAVQIIASSRKPVLILPRMFA